MENIHKKVADHHSGKNTLGEKQLAHLEHKVNAYQHQIEELDRELDEDVSFLFANVALREIPRINFPNCQWNLAVSSSSRT